MVDEETTVVAKPKPRRQFGVKHLLALMLVIAGGIVGWKKFFYQHPAYVNSLYEKAPYSRSGSITKGPTRISLKSVSRTDRNGTLFVEDGFGKALNATVRNAQVLKDSGAWLDSTQIEFAAEGGTFEVIGLRVFDFKTRQILDKVTPASGQRMADLETLQIFRLGEKLPDRVDVFLRVLVYGPGNKPTKLLPLVGATCKLPGGTLEVLEVVEGFRSYSAATGIVGDPASANHETCVMLKFDGQWPTDAKYMVTAVKKDGTRYTRDEFVRFPGSYLDPKDANKRSELIFVKAGLNDIQHLELRPLEGRHKFFFEGVRLPQTSAAKFGNPPSPIVQLSGVEETIRVPELAPLDVSIQVMKGDAVSGTIGNESGNFVKLRSGGATNVDTETTIVDWMHGISNASSTVIVNPGSKPGILTRWRKSGTSYGSGRFLRHETLDTPIGEIESLQMQMPKP